MGVSFDRAVRIAGYRPSVFKQALRAYLRTRDPARLIDLKSVFSNRRDGAIVYEECIDRGLIDPVTNKVTEQGMTVARAKVAMRTPLAKARSVLDDLLARVDLLNADPEAVTRVDRIWLFGSLMREEPTVGDIDLAICRSRDARFDQYPDAQVDEAKRLIERFKDAPQYWDMPWDRIDWLYKRMVFGARRHPLLAGAQEGTTDLQSLGAPCRLIYDRLRGGRVDDPILARHPDSPGRSNEVPPPDALPDLAPAELRPMDARWLTGFTYWGPVSPYEIFRGWTPECRKLFPDYPKDLRVVTDDSSLVHFPWTPKTVKRKGLDGRNAVAIVDATEWSGTSITLHRAIEKTHDRWMLRASFSDLALHRSRKYVDLYTLPDMVAAVSLILAVDAERMFRRANEAGMQSNVTIRISAEGLREDMREHFAQRIADMLARRVVAIEPAGNAASVQVELT
ncbi:hypothetical protein [Sphingopyxis sp.]|jgi:predicted nucleotidyltransferase|uniref:hypothetical protein n=1 Tax=Sphingopyxis sp. TaxID=1908224 RepID=UPI003F6FCA30